MISGPVSSEMSQGDSPVMRIAVWNAAGLPRAFATGVGRVVVNLVRAVDRRSDTQAVFLIPKGTTSPVGSHHQVSPLGHLQQSEVNYRVCDLDAMWRTCGWPPLDRWAGDCSWLLCPRELWCPPGRLKYAIVVHDLYQFEPEFAARSWRLSLKRRLVWERALSRADVIFSVSEFTKQRLRALFGVDEGKVVVCPNAVEPSYLDCNQADQKQIVEKFIQGPYVLNVGGLRRKKGGAAQLALAAELARRKSDLSLVVVGPIDPEFANEIRGQSHLVVVDRGIPDGELRALTAQAQVCMMLSEYEGFGIPLLEGMACGVPVLGADRASIPEVLGCRDALVDPRDTAAVADLVELLHGDEKARQEAILRGAHRLDAFSWDKSADIIVRAMRERSA